MSKHTPGPWKLIVSSEQQRRIIQAGKHALMCDEMYYPWCPENDADWQLIAASPDLLNALRRAVDALDALTDRVDRTGFSEADEFLRALDEIDLGRAAIAKATGSADA